KHKCRNDPTRLAMLAAEIQQIYDPTSAQKRALTGAAERLTPEQRQAVQAGLLSLSAIHNAGRRDKSGDRKLAGLIARRGELIDQEIDAFIAEVGADAVLAGLDRATPPQIAAE